MITNFEQITKELTTEEKIMVDTVTIILLSATVYKPVKSPELIWKIYAYHKYKYPKLSGPRLRKTINYIRSNSLLPIIGTSKGYFVSYDEEILSKQIKSLTERANSIMDCVYGLNKLLKNKV